MDFKDVLAIASSGVAVSITIFNWRGTRFRGKLKDDLEIIKRYREELLAAGVDKDEISKDERYALLQQKIARKLTRAYGVQGTDWSDVLKAVAVFCLAAFLLGYSGFENSPWARAVGLVCLVITTYFLYEAVRNRGVPTQA
jgi:hypothetical protein